MVAGGLALLGTGGVLLVRPARAQVTPAERQEAARAHPQVVAQFGGAYEGSQQAYLNQIGQRVATAAGVPGGCNFTLVNSDVVNAFAVPGCYVYVTRGLMEVANSEDELAFVMGHEIGHVMAQHARKRQERSLLTGLAAMILGAATKNDSLAQLLGQGAQLYTLGFSRNQEYEADDLGARYLAKAGYSSRGAPDMLDGLQRHDTLIARTRGRDAKSTPEWASTHPLAADRVRRASNQAQAAGASRVEPQRDRYLSAIDGMIFGDDPAQGFVQGRSFAHPQLRIAFDAPPGFTLTNSVTAVGVEGPNGKAIFGSGRARGTLEDYALQVLRSVVGNTPAQAGRPERTTINGLDAVIMPARVQTNQGSAEMTVAVYRADTELAYQFVTLTGQGQSAVFEPMIRSMRRISEREAAALQPRHLQVVDVRPSDTVASMSSKMIVDQQPQAWFETLNGVSNDNQLRDLREVKLVGYAR